MPTEMNLADGAKDCFRTLESFRNEVSGWKEFNTAEKVTGARLPTIQKYIDFSKIESIDLPSAIVLLAEFNRAFTLSNQRQTNLVNLNKWHSQTVRKLDELGFFELANVPAGTIPQYAVNEDVMILPFISGENAVEMLPITQQVLQLANFASGNESTDTIDMESVLGVNVTRLTTGISEAISNMAHHAYPDDHTYKYRHIGRFWFGAKSDRLTGRIQVAFYDQGVSIPVTYQKYGFFDRVKNRLSNLGTQHPHDGIYIKAAIEFGNTQTGEENRGQGLPQIRDAVSACENGRFLVASRSGLYDFRVGTGEEITAYDSSIGGTLLYWEFSVKPVRSN